MRLLAFGLAFGLAAAPPLSGAEKERRRAPSIYVGGVVNAASFTAAPDNYLVPNGIFSVFGEDLALRTRGVSQADLVNGRLPTSLGGVSVVVAGQPAPLYYVSPTQINAQAPANLPPGETTLWISRESLLSPKVTVKVRQADPGLFMFLGRPVVAHLDYSLVGRGEFEGSTPARPGEVVILFATALGPTIPGVLEGELPGFAAPILMPLNVWLGERLLPPAAVLYAGQAPGLAGLYQINLALPDDAPHGEPEIAVEIEGVRSQPGMRLAIDP